MDIEKATCQTRSASSLRSSTTSPLANSDGGSIKSEQQRDTSENGDIFNEKGVQVQGLSSGPVVLPIEILHDDSEFVEGGWEGWLVVAGCFLIGAPTVGDLLWGVFQAYHSAHLLRGTPDATISLIGASQNAMMAAAAFVSGKLGDRYGYKCFIVAGCLIVFASQLSAAWCKQFWSIFITQGVLQGLGCGLTLPMVFALPSQWFKRRRGLATGIVIAGAALGGAISSLIVQAMLLRMSLHMTLFIYSFIQGGTLFLGCLLIKTRSPPSHESRTEHKKIQWVDSAYFRDPVFWSCWFALALFILGYQIPFVFISVYIGETIPSTSPQLASLPISVMNFSSAVGRTTVGLVADQIGFVNAFILTATISAFSQAILWNLTTHTYAGAIVFSVIFGLTGPCYVSLTTPIAASLYGTQSLATLTGLLNISGLPGALSGPPIGGYILKASGRNWHLLACYSGVVQFAGVICVLYARFKREPRILARL
ncbi:MFS transporter [Rhizoctonia solani AG-3 Rhs1AP]|uniref:MFS transporter n=2 Tax=Rhizoctonia solani AG-3 TaxID=1086053 RepID=A0A074RTH9_9AGAM|nr:MFS transporter [Rhizoctonia solani AG-3 Rhs1AP]KEP50174.1 MFS transporter [Rhizoctonia solani 123E]